LIYPLNRLRRFYLPFGLSTIYLHMSKLDVVTGQKVRKGDKIGEVGSTGRSTGPHLHWGAQWYNKRIDPLSLSILNEVAIYRKNPK
jgi:murein DD-endopeptidase MepM/ murein hydrolase activator NlpD